MATKADVLEDRKPVVFFCDVCVCVCVYVYAQSCLTPWARARQAPLSTEFSRQEDLEWVAISFSRGSSRPRDQALISCVFCIGRQILYHCTTWEAPFFRETRQ